MLFHTSKYKIMHFTEYYMNGQKLESVTEEKDLGIIISHDLKASSQSTQAYNKKTKCLD